MAVPLSVNGKTVSVDADPSTPLLWALRDNLEMTGTKFGCGMAYAGPVRCTSTAKRCGLSSRRFSLWWVKK